MNIRQNSILRNVLAGILAILFLGSGTVLATPVETPVNTTTSYGHVAADSSRAENVVNIPYGTTSIGYREFAYNHDLTTVIIPDTVKTIGDEAFAYCSNLIQIIIPDSVTTIGEKAFEYSGISKAVLGNGVTNIGALAFNRCTKLATLTLGNQLQVIGSRAFWGCTSLTEVMLPNSVTQIIGYNKDDISDDLDSDDRWDGSNLGAFGNCTSLRKVVLGNGLTDLEGHTFRGCTSLQDVVFGSKLRTIGPMAFRNTVSLKALEFPDSLVSIGSKAFKQSGISTIQMDNKLTSIGDYAFQRCKNLTDVNFGTGLRTIGKGAFSGCVSLTKALLPNTVSMLNGGSTDADGVFYNCTALTQVTTGSGLLHIGNNAFHNCTALETIQIGSRTQTIGASAFRNCGNLSELIVPDSVTEIGANIARNAGVSKVVTGNGVKGIPENAFRDCADLTDLTMGSGITNIQAGAFAGCQSLVDVVIPNSVTSIGASSKEGAFEDCVALESVTFGVRSYPTPNTFDGCYGLLRIYYPGTQAEWDQLLYTRPAGVELVFIDPIPDPSPDPLPSATPEDPALANAVELEGGEFVYADALAPLYVRVTDDRITSLTGQIVCSGFSQASIPVQMTKVADAWQGGRFTLNVTAVAGQSVSCKLTNVSAVMNGRTVALPDQTYSAPVYQFNLPADYLTISAPSEPRSGDTISVQIAGRGEGVSAMVQTTGLEILSTSSSFCDDDVLVLLPDFGLSTVTYLCRVTARQGQPLAFSLLNVELAADGMVLYPPEVSWTTVAAAGGPTAIPVPAVPTIAGYQGGRINNKPYYVKTSGFSTMYYLRSSSGRMVRVSAPSVTGSNRTVYYPINNGGTVLFPRLENGKLTCFCVFQGNMEMPVLSAVAEAHPQTTINGYQTGMVNGKPYYAKTSGASTMFYLRSSSGRMARVSAPYVTASNGTRYYPVNYGGAVLFPRLANGRISAYVSGDGETVLTVL